ncbi:MAG TPA: hypothetical protein VHO69_17360 [Phototrophicaceae bacterium]|nr:hypothetical protein [Phototrophicaceae bacterium]
MAQRIRLLLLLVLLFGAGHFNAAQDVPEHLPAWQVFLQRDVDEAGTDRLTFINPFTGEQTTADVSGERYTPVGDAVLYFDPAANRVMVAAPDGTVTEHPFIQLGGDTRRVDWLVSPDQTLLAWTLTSGTGSLTTVTTVANLDGTNPRQVLVDGPRDGIRALPVAFNADKTTLYLDFQPDGIGEFTPFPQYAGLFALDLTSGQWERLPGEPGCFCGAGFGSGLLLRLAVAQDLSGFDLRVVNLVGGVEQKIPALTLQNYTQAGDVVLAPDGTRAVYALAQIRDFGKPNQSTQTVFVLVNLQDMTQAPLVEPITTFVEPLAWTEDNTAVLFTSRQRDGTWKISLSDGKLVKVAEATYLGTVG